MEKRDRQRIAARKHYEANKEKMKARIKVRKIQHKAKLRSLVCRYLLDNPCVDCGESDPVVLEFDHLDPALKSFNIGQGISAGLSEAKIVSEIRKCEVRCANCHRRKTRVTIWDAAIKSKPDSGQMLFW